MEGKAFIVVCLPSGEDTLLYRRTTLKASPRGEAPPQAVMRGPITRKCKQHFMLRSPSSVSLFARHLLPREKAFIVVLFSSSKTIFPHQCVQPSSPWHADRRSAQGVRSTTEGEIFKGTDGACADPDTRIFPATGMAGGQGHSQLKTSNFFVTYRFFVTFFTEKSNVPRFPFSRSLVPLFPIPSSQKAAPGSSIRRRCKSL